MNSAAAVLKASGRRWRILCCELPVAAVDRAGGRVWYCTGHNGKIYRWLPSGKSELWATLTEAQAQAVGAALDLPEEAVTQLQVVPYKGSLPTAVPTDPLIYRFYELISVYGTTFKSLIHEEFGDGIMSAIDFNMDLTREADPKGDRVKITMSGKFLPYKTY